MTATFTGPGGSDPVAAIRALRAAANATEGDLLYALQRQRSRILKRTAAGVDADGAAFAPYSLRYAKKKAAYGRTGVDLRGRNAPNMLQAIVTTAGGLSSSDESTGGDSDAPAHEGSIAFYDERAALLAQVHNEGEGRQPRRHFFAASDEDVLEMERDIGERIEVRLRGRAA
jgi:hypothetical protein